MASVTLKNVKKVFDSTTVAVDHFNLEIEDGEFIVLVGPSGCGKSTTLRMIAGLEGLTEGDIHIGEILANDLPPKDRDIAMVFQNYALYPHMTVYDNLAFGLKLRKYAQPEIDARVRDAAKILGIEDLLDRRPQALSGGQRQRVAVGRAIVRKPKVFLFDEPLSNLDAKLRVQMRTEISRLHAQLDATMVYVTHDQVEAMTMGDRLVVMRDGHIQQIGEPIRLYEHPANRFVAGFIGSPAMNFLEGKLVRESGLTFTTDTLRIPIRDQNGLSDHIDQPVTLGIRPEHIASGETHPARTHEITITVDVVEPMGNETNLYFTLDNAPLIARLPGSQIPRVGDALTLRLDLSNIHLFSQTGDVLA